MTVNEWNPASSGAQLSAKLLQRLARLGEDPNHPTLGLSLEEVTTLAPIMAINKDDWLKTCEDLPTDTLIKVARWLTLAEEQLTGWTAGDRSPVIAIAKLLRQRDAYPQELTTWIRAHSTNRFLPYGSLMDRL